MEPSRETPADHLRALRIISAGLLIGALFLLLVVLIVRPSMAQIESLDVLAYVASAFAVLSFPIASILRAARYPTSSADQDPEYWLKRRQAQIVSCGILEGAAHFCCVALLVSKPIWPLFALIVPMGTMVAWFPRE